MNRVAPSLAIIFALLFLQVSFAGSPISFSCNGITVGTSNIICGTTGNFIASTAINIQQSTSVTVNDVTGGNAPYTANFLFSNSIATFNTISLSGIASGNSITLLVNTITSAGFDLWITTNSGAYSGPVAVAGNALGTWTINAIIKDSVGANTFTTNTIPALTIGSLAVSVTSSPTLPATLNAGNTIAFNALAAGGSGNYISYNFAVYNSIASTLVYSTTSTANSLLYLIPANQVGNTLYANVTVTDNTMTTSNTATSSRTGVLTVGSVPAGAVSVALGGAGTFAILAESGISTTGTTSITGDIGVSPAAATSITGFNLVLNSSGQFATSSLVSGKVYAADYSPPTPSKMTTAVSDMYTAYTFAAGETNPTATGLGAGDIGGMTLTPGLYKWSTGVTIPTSVTLNCGGNSGAVFVFQISGTLTVSSAAQVILSGGCQPQNIFWQVASGVTLGTTSSFQGIILSATAITFDNGATLTGRALAQTAVALIGDTVTAPSGSPTPPGPSGAQAYILASNSVSVDSGQYEVFTSTASGFSVSPYTFNFLVSYSANNLLVANDLASASVLSSNFIWTVPSVAVATNIYANVIVSNAVLTANSVNTANIVINPVLSAGAPSPLNPTVAYPGSQTFTANPTGGTTPYSYQWYSGSSSTCTSDSLISGANSATYTTSTGQDYCYSVTDSASTPVTTYSSTTALSIQTIFPSGPGGGGSRSGATTVSTTTVSTTTVSTTTIPVSRPVENTSSSNTTVSVSKGNNQSVNFTNYNVYLVILSNSSILSNVNVTVTGIMSTASPAPSNYALLSAYNITAKGATLLVTLHYTCGLPSSRIAPYIFLNGKWIAITPFTTNVSACTETFSIPGDPTVGLIEGPPAAAPTTTIPATTAPTTIIQNTTSAGTPTSTSIGQYALPLGIAAIVIIAIIIYALTRSKSSAKSKK